MKCSACGSLLKEGASFCLECGHTIGSEPAMVSKAAEPAVADAGFVPGSAETVAPLSPVDRTENSGGRKKTKRLAGDKKPLKVMLVSIAVILAGGLGAIAWAANSGKTNQEAAVQMPPEPLPATSSGTASANPAPSTAPTTKAPAVQTNMELPNFGSSTRIRDGLMIHQGSSGVAVQVAGESSIRSFSAPQISPGLELTGQTDDITGSLDQPLRAVLLETRKPASGLEPEQYGFSLQTYASDSSKPLADVAVANLDHARFNSLKVFGTGDGSVAVVDPNSSAPSVRFFAVGTLAENPAAPGHYLGQQGTTVFVAPRDSDCNISAWSATTGTRLWEQDFAAGQTSSYCKIESNAGGLVVKIDGKADYFIVVDPNTGQTRSPQLTNAQEIHFDPAAALAVVEFNESAVGLPALRVYETEKWGGLLDVSVEKRKALGLREYHLFASKIYMTTTDEQPIIDAITGAKITGNWTDRPVAQLSKDWTVVKDESRGRYSMHATKNGVFTG